MIVGRSVNDMVSIQDRAMDQLLTKDAIIRESENRQSGGIDFKEEGGRSISGN